MEAAPPGIHCRGVVKRYELGSRSVEALRGVDLSIEGAGFHAIMGASGSGKSSLMHLIAGLDRPTAGSVEVAGARIDTMGERDLTLYRRRRIGIVFQHFNLLPAMSALDNVMLPALLDGADRRSAARRAQELLDELGVGARADHRPDALSGGEQQRVAIARALFFAPSVILADEPTGNLDSAASARLFEILRGIARGHGTLLLMVTHEPAAAAHCERVTVLRDGVVAGTFATENLDAGTLALRAQELARPTR
jgi:putative ABC transport system ATP-binding protein